MPLEGRRTSVKDKDRLDAEEEQLADSAKESDNMTVAQRIPFFVSDRLEELIYPDGRIHREAFLVERFQLDRTSAGLQDRP